MSRLVPIAALVAIAGIAGAAVLFVSGEGAGMERLALLLALLGSIVIQVVNLGRTDEAAKEAHVAAEAVNGTLLEALHGQPGGRRASDPPADTAEAEAGTRRGGDA